MVKANKANGKWTNARNHIIYLGIIFPNEFPLFWGLQVLSLMIIYSWTFFRCSLFFQRYFFLHQCSPFFVLSISRIKVHTLKWLVSIDWFIMLHLRHFIPVCFFTSSQQKANFQFDTKPLQNEKTLTQTLAQRRSRGLCFAKNIRNALPLPFMFYDQQNDNMHTK